MLKDENFVSCGKEKTMMIERKVFKIYLPRMVHGYWPFGHHLIAQQGVHDAVENQHGAVSVVLDHGQLLGVKPDEYERVQ